MQGQVFRVLKCSIEEDDLLVQNIVKLREREGQGVDPGRSLKGHL